MAETVSSAVQSVSSAVGGGVGTSGVGRSIVDAIGRSLAQHLLQSVFNDNRAGGHVTGIAQQEGDQVDRKEGKVDHNECKVDVIILEPSDDDEPVTVNTPPKVEEVDGEKSPPRTPSPKALPAPSSSRKRKADDDKADRKVVQRLDMEGMQKKEEKKEKKKYAAPANYKPAITKEEAKHQNKQNVALNGSYVLSVYKLPRTNVDYIMDRAQNMIPSASKLSPARIDTWMGLMVTGDDKMKGLMKISECLPMDEKMYDELEPNHRCADSIGEYKWIWVISHFIKFDGYLEGTVPVGKTSSGLWLRLTNEEAQFAIDTIRDVLDSNDAPIVATGV